MSVWTISLIVYFASWLAIPHLLLQRKRPAETLAWLWAILLFPYIGIVLYLLIGTDRFRRKRLRRYAHMRAFRQERKLEGFSTEGFRSRHSIGFARQISYINDTPVTRATGARLLPSASAFYEALERRIREARHHVHIQFFIWREDASGERLRDALVAAVRRGVEVRVLLDEIGSVTLRTSYFDELVRAGGEFSWFNTINPWKNRYFLNLRNHRKLQIVDGRYAFVGGMNVGDEYKGLGPGVGPWRDLQVEVEGPIATALQDSFADDWYFGSGKRFRGAEYFPETGTSVGWPGLIVTGGPDSAHRPVEKSTVAMISQAQTRVWMTTGYFVPNELLVTTLQLTAARGVDVRLLVSEKSDHPLLLRVGRSYYEDMLRAGVRIYEYAQAINHTKAGVVDDDWALVGSANLDNRSMRLNFELNVVLGDPHIVRELATLIGGDFNDSKEIELEAFRQRSRKEVLFEAVLRPFAPVL